MIGVCGIGEGEEGEGEKEKGGEKGKRKVENQYRIKKRNREEEKTERRSEVEVEVRVEAKLGMLIHSCDARKSRISFSSTRRIRQIQTDRTGFSTGIEFSRVLLALRSYNRMHDLLI